MKKKICFSVFFVGILFFANASAVLSRPYKVFAYKTEHFDILFPQKSEQIAQIIAENADSLYEKAVKTLNSDVNIRMPVVISPDSDEFSVKYTHSPYNRIVIFESVPCYYVQNDKMEILSQLYKEIFKAVLQSKRSKFNNFIANTIGGKSYQPVSQLNMPFSFIEGFCFLSDEVEKMNGEIFSQNLLNDAESLQILVKAKMEGNFPSHFQVSVTNDIYPYNKLIFAAAAGFAAYLIQSRGFEKYTELWNESGKINFFFADGIFYNVYKESLRNLWNDFYESVPLPQKAEQITELEKKTTPLLPNNSESLYRNLIFSDYGLIWYDEIKHEVDIFDNFDNAKNPFSMRKLLFLANDIEKLSLSVDGRYLIVSFKEIKNRAEFKNKVCRIYDLRERKFLKQKFFIEKASLFVPFNTQKVPYSETKERQVCIIAGINIEDKTQKLQVISFLPDNDDFNLLFEKKIENNELPKSVCFTPNGKICILISKNETQFLKIIDITTLEEQNFFLELKNEDSVNVNLKISDLRVVKSSTSKISNIFLDFVYMFDYYVQNDVSFARAGYITMNENFFPEKAFFMTDDLPGGVNSACLRNDSIFYSAQKILCDELKMINKNDVNFAVGNLIPFENSSDFFAENKNHKDENSAAQIGENLSDAEELNFLKKIDESESATDEIKSSETQNTVAGIENVRYNPLKYLFPFSVMPMLPIYSISVDEGAKLFPGLGVTFISQTDPFENTDFFISAGWNYAKLNFEKFWNSSENYEKEQKQYELLSRKDKSVAIFLKNSSLPVDISIGSIFRFNFDGEYFYKGIAGTSWQIPLGMNFSNMKIKIESNFTASTDYYDSNLIYQNESLSGWPKFSDSYELFEAAVETEYSNIHQYGITPYEKRGFSAGVRIYSIWDLPQIKILNKYREEQTEQIQINNGDYFLTEAQLKEAYDARMLAISQINLAFFAKIEIPRLTPLKMIDGWVLSVPATVSASLFEKTGSALKVQAEMLLLGKEIHNGFSLLQLYFGRIGLKTGYELNLKYDTTKILKPDIRRQNYLGEILSNTFADECFYFIFNIDFTSSIGFMSSSMLSMQNKFAFYPRQNGFLYSFNFVMKF